MKKNGHVRLIRILAAAVAIITAASVLPLSSSALKAWEKNDDGYYYGASQSGENLTKAPGVTCRGIDISTWNGALNWTKIKQQYDAGTISFVIIRCGYGANLEKNDDDYWKRNADACTKYGIPFGVYLYSYALTVEDSLDEADHVLRLVEGYNPTYPIYYDFENTKTQTNISGEQKRDMVYAFCDKVKAQGYEVGFYSMRSWIASDKHLGLVDYEAKDYSLWIAEFNPTLKYTKSFDLWQCTSEYKLTGQSGGTCDVSFSYITERTVEHCYVTFDMNGRSGTPPKAIHANRNEAYGELPTAETDTGEHLIGWYTEPEGGELVTADTICKLNGRQTLYARWACDFELSVENVTTSGGELKQTITSLTPFQTITIKANEGYYLPTRIALSEGYTYTLNDDGTATITGDPHSDASLEVFGVKNGELEPPVSTDFLPEASSYGGSDGSIGGFTSGMEVSIKGDGSDIIAIETSAGSTKRIENLSAGYIYVRYAATSEKEASRWIKLQVPSKAQTPDIGQFTVTQPSDGDDTGSIVCPDKYYEYSTDGGVTYTAVDQHTLTVDYLEAWKKVHIRRAECDGYKASDPLTVDITPFNESSPFHYLGQYIKTGTPYTSFIVNDKVIKSDDLGYISIEEEWFGTTLSITKASLCDDIDAVKILLDVPLRPASPAITVKDETIAGQKDGGISGITKDMQYSTNGGKKWQAATEEMINGSYSFEYNTEYLFRQISYDDGENFPSETFTAVIHSGNTVKVTFRAEGAEDIVIELRYGETLSMPSVPVKAGADMELSCWDSDLEGKTLTEDTTVNAVYVEKGCGSSLSLLAMLPALACVSFVFRRRH